MCRSSRNRRSQNSWIKPRCGIRVCSGLTGDKTSDCSYQFSFGNDRVIGFGHNFSCVHFNTGPTCGTHCKKTDSVTHYEYFGARNRCLKHQSVFKWHSSLWGFTFPGLKPTLKYTLQIPYIYIFIYTIYIYWSIGRYSHALNRGCIHVCADRHTYWTTWFSFPTI